ncbi:MAG: hypothetical protein HZA54_11245, partial [Planctomycetes bacterium]|nr:hypothetical protein [Planctomycetota bacterium]
MPQRIKLSEISVRMGYVSLREVLGVIQVGRRLDKLRGTARPRVSPGLQVAVALGAHRPVPAPLLACPVPAAGGDPFTHADPGEFPWQGYDAFADCLPAPLAALPVDPLELPLPPIAPARLRAPRPTAQPKPAPATAPAPPPPAAPTPRAPVAPATAGVSSVRSWPRS